MNRLSPLLILTALLIPGIAPPVRAQTPAPQPLIGTEAPGFTLATVQGDTLALGDLRGQIVVIHFGASW